MTGKWHGSPPTREQVLAEIARELTERRSSLPKHGEIRLPTPLEAEVRIDRLQAGYDYIMKHWQRDRPVDAA